MYANRGNFRAF